MGRLRGNEIVKRHAERRAVLLCYAVIFLKLFQQADAVSGDTLLCTGEAQLFLSRRLDRNTVDIAFHGSGKILAHLHDMRRELGRLREYGCVDIADLPALFTDKRTDMAQQCQTVRTLRPDRYQENACRCLRARARPEAHPSPHA